MKKSNKKGFTIVELVIVIAVIAILSAVLIPTFSNITTKAKDSAAIQEARNTYTEYYSLLDGELDEADADFIYKNKDRFVVILNGQVQDTAYKAELEAVKALSGDNSATLGTETGKYNKTQVMHDEDGDNATTNDITVFELYTYAKVA